ncbi:MAG TPA: dicarboxylate/amino acid:cation symporter [Gemmatimonadaceae bacterium]|nr:dicarboxylate/amino acid:cation symporter [Gemmatimonadaceae bacterium]
MADPSSRTGKGASARTLPVSTLVGLFLGLATGIAINVSGSSALARLDVVVEPVGTMWVNAMRMCVIPLVIPLLIGGVASNDDARLAGKMGGISIALFLLLLGTAAVFTLVLSTPILDLINPGSVGSLQGRAGGEGAASPRPNESFAEWLTGLVPVNPVSAAASDDILPLIVFSILFGLALTKVARERREPVLRLCRAITETMLLLVRGVLRLAPIGVFGLAFPLAVRAGLGAAGVIGYWIILVSSLLIVFTLVLYPIAAIGGRVPLRRFAAAAAPAQAVAVSSRSSIASLPSLIEGAERHLKLPTSITGLVLPLSVSTFKVNRTVSSTVKFLFLARLYGIEIEPVSMLTFILTITLLSFSSPGLPGAGSLLTLPVYVGVGLPVEGALLLSAVDDIPDIFKTLLNVTGDMTVAVLVARIMGIKPGVTARESGSVDGAVPMRGQDDGHHAGVAELTH